MSKISETKGVVGGRRRRRDAALQPLVVLAQVDRECLAI
jgi:hypothetical protein